MASEKSPTVSQFVIDLGFQKKVYRPAQLTLWVNNPNVDKTAVVGSILSSIVRGDNKLSGLAFLKPTYNIGCGLGNDLGAFDSGADPKSTAPSKRYNSLMFIPDGGFRSYMFFNSALRFDAVDLRLHLLRLMSFNTIPTCIAQDVSAYYGAGDENAQEDKSTLADLLKLFSDLSGLSKLSETTQGQSGSMFFDICFGINKHTDKQGKLRYWLVGLLEPRKPYNACSFRTVGLFQKVFDNAELDFVIGPIVESKSTVVLYYCEDRPSISHLAALCFERIRSSCQVLTYGGDGEDVFSFGNRLLPINSKSRCPVLVIGEDRQLVAESLYSLGYQVCVLLGESVYHPSEIDPVAQDAETTLIVEQQ